MSSQFNTPTCLANLANSTLCLVNGYCNVVNSTYSMCECNPGKKGEECDELIVPITWVYAFDGVFYFLVFFLWIFLAIRRSRRTKGEEFEAERLKGVQSSHPNSFGLKTLFVYRLLVFCFAFGVHISVLAVNPPVQVYKFYTIWNFITVIIYFGLGLGLTTFALIKGPEAIRESKYWSFNATLLYLLLEVELPITLL